LGSTNGTYLNEQPVEVPAVLTSGDHLRCGQVVLQIAIDGTDFPHSSA
jgi:pSer/pThr/pTyr-binding forkhead associated (FHA) protein